MPHDTPLIATIVAGLGRPSLFRRSCPAPSNSTARWLPSGGVAVGPFTPGYVADQGLATELAEIGVILLMFGVGLHFSLGDLLSVRAIALPGAVVQIVVASLMGLGLALFMGWTIGAGLVLALLSSVASTVVLLRAMQERRLMETERGRIAVGWLIVEDLAMVLALVLLPAWLACRARTAVRPLRTRWQLRLGMGFGGVLLLTVAKVVRSSSASC